MKASRGQRMGPGDGGEEGGSAVEPALLSPSCAHNGPLGIPPPRLGREGVASAQGGGEDGERGRAEAAVWKGMGAAAAMFLLSTRIPAAGSLGKICCLGVACVWPDLPSGQLVPAGTTVSSLATSCHLLANRCSRGPI